MVWAPHLSLRIALLVGVICVCACGRDVTGGGGGGLVCVLVVRLL